MTDQANLADHLAKTLAAILRRYDEHRRQHSGPQAMAIEDAGVAPARWKTPADIPPRWVSALDDAADDPVRFSLKASAREAGWNAYAHGGLDFMRTVSDLAQEAGASGAIIDKWWDRIGGPNGTWWA